MIARIERTEVDVKAARLSLDRMLLASYLDSFKASSLQVALRLINDVACSGTSLYVDLTFSCPAILRDGRISSGNLGNINFFVGRPKFLPAIYGKIGVEISGVQLYSDGRPVLSMSDSVVELVGTDEDMALEDSIWQVEMESPAGSALSLGGSVSCVATGTAATCVLGV